VPNSRSGDDLDVLLLTGASTGLGLALARLLLAGGKYRLILTARADSLERFAAEGIAESERVHLRPLDVTQSIEQHRVVEEACDRWGGVDVLINNAGLAYRAVVEHFPDDPLLDALRINFYGPVSLIRLVLPRMREKRRGRIVNISSVGGMMAMPTMAPYSASKFALEGVTEALWYEVRPWGIKVSLIEPGFIHSESFRNTRYTDKSRRAMQDVANPYHAHYAHMDGMIARLMDFTRATPDAVARKIVRTLGQRNPQLRVPATWDAHAFSLLRRLLPRRLYHAVLYRMLPKIDRWGPPK
jgi:short-subunit dehydrogenase